MSDSNADKLKGLREDYNKVFSTEEGKRVLKDLEAKCMYGYSIFDKDHSVMAYQAGLRDVYLSIINIMKLDIEALERITNQQQQGG